MLKGAADQNERTERICNGIHSVYRRRDARTLARSRRAVRLRAAYQEIDRAQRAATDAFASLNEWRKAPSTYDLDVLGCGTRTAWRSIPGRGLFDHPISFQAKRRYVAMVGQPDPPAVGDLDAWRVRLEARGLVLHVPPDPLASIHNPGGTLFIVITKPGVKVKWLPDQDGRLADRWAARREA